MEENNKKVTRVALYADLRDKISKMDTLSFDDPDRDSKYGLNSKKPIMPIIHEEAMSNDELKTEHIKKNTLSISIEDLIKQNDDYTIALEKKDIDKSFKNFKPKSNLKLKWIVGLAIGISILIIAIIVILCCLLIK